MNYQSVLDFWFNELTPAHWWKKDEVLDKTIAERFTGLHEQATRNELFGWRTHAKGALAEIIVLDQFSRNIYRDLPAAFASDAQALALAQTAIGQGVDQALSPVERSFLYLPFMHSESRLIHQQAVALYTQLGEALNLEFELKHKVIIDRFGRYPHRNTILGRNSSAEEMDFLTQPGSSF
ncbi:DUF924 family protein [Cellvibrio japonicus]|uniref:Uncharacterized protein conserved in bacteria n=1 Tax=Cellvibrio japonicus (strain Ueda107) TaxID=498211 RepID=B3PDY8_CELJU|nr:DUF924 family protein [Cellvibrio japonicus]ACE85694.1 Uncharacterized protein conserved in bacteria [Cellvibrio japonicus Ueda107]QEI13472.1 DUF924 domain-containing protein [Cellvibrio japonicus]QEI17046.1 DUF924 domain-containing protein [Cellvibrio japonicus]QEI20624.1 DUF924 domain-containing protein [Cellvibrio japonicus]